MGRNIGRIYEDQGDLSKAEQYMSRTVEIEEEIDLPALEESRKASEDIRAKLRGRQGQSPVIARGHSGQTQESAPASFPVCPCSYTSYDEGHTARMTRLIRSV